MPQCEPWTDEAEAAFKAPGECHDILDRAGLHFRECLGCGQEGCAFLLSDGKIAKVTPKVEEARFASTILELGASHPALPRIDGVWYVEDCDVYLLVREDLWDLPLGDPDRFDQITYKLGGRAKQALRQPEKMEAFLTWASNMMPDDEERQDVEPEDFWAWQQLVELTVWLLDRGLLLQDLHSENLSVRPGTKQLVVRDLGRSSYGEKGWPKEWERRVSALEERRHGTRADPLKHVDIVKLIPQYDIKLVDHKKFKGTDIMAINAITTLGKQYGMAPNEIWIDKRLRKYAELLTLHEIVEHQLRLRNWLYKPSHKLALQYEKRYFGGTPEYEEFLEEFGAP